MESNGIARTAQFGLRRCRYRKVEFLVVCYQMYLLGYTKGATSGCTRKLFRSRFVKACMKRGSAQVNRNRNPKPSSFFR